MPSVNYRLNRPKGKNGELKNNPVSILCKYYHEGIEVELSTGHKVLPAKWTGSRVKGIDRATKINKYLSDLENILMDVPIDHRNISESEHEQIVRRLIKNPVKIQPDTKEKKTSIFTVWRFIAQCVKEKDLSTAKRYMVLARALHRFMNGERLDFSRLDFNFYDQFKNFLYDTPNPLYIDFHLQYDPRSRCYVVTPGSDSLNVIGLFDDTVFKYFIQLKTVCKWVEKRGYKVHASYETWEIIKREYPPITLTYDELKNLESTSFTEKNVISMEEIEDLNKRWSAMGYTQGSIDKRVNGIINARIKGYAAGRDYLSFESRTGQRISDIKNIHPSDVKDDVWKFTQRKGNRIKAKQIDIPLDGYSLPALLILQSYNFNLPRISDQKINENIKDACRVAGINEYMYIERWAGNKKIRIYGNKYEFLSTHTGKKSFITILAGEGVPVSILSEITGTSQRTIERHYLGKVDIKKVRGYLTKVEENKPIMRKIS